MSTDPTLIELDRVPFADVAAVERVLVVGAHPDDPDYACGGLILRMIEANSEVSVVVVSDGGKGVGESTQDDRRDEQLRAATELGVTDVSFLGLTDGDVWDTPELRRELVRVIRSRRPNVLVTHDPLTRRYRQHPDHRAVGFASLAAAFPAARLGTYFPELASEGLEPWVVSQGLLYASDASNWIVELDEHHLQRKLSALKCHESQTGSFGPSLEERVRTRAQEAAASTPFRLAESFHCVDLV